MAIERGLGAGGLPEEPMVPQGATFENVIDFRIKKKQVLVRKRVKIIPSKKSPLSGELTKECTEISKPDRIRKVPAKLKMKEKRLM